MHTEPPAGEASAADDSATTVSDRPASGQAAGAQHTTAEETAGHWSDRALDPHSPEARQFRRAQLAAASRSPVFDRLEYLESLATGKRVLDIGSVAHFAERATHDDWLFGRLARTASYALGVDILPEAVAKLQAQGHNIRCLDITTEDVGEVFDVVTCGEVLEHLDTPGPFFSAVAKLLKPGGLFVLTTPNPFEVWEALRQAIGRGHVSVDHVLYAFPSSIAELCQRRGFRLESYRGTLLRGKQSLKHRALYTLCRPILRPEFYCSTFIYECVKL